MPRNYTTTENTAEAQVKLTDIKDKRGRRLPLTNGGFTLLDESDYEKYKDYNWRNNGKGYVVRSVRAGGQRTVLLHAEIAGTPKGKVTDHINGNKLDNRRSNLRVCTQKENCRGYKTIRSDSRTGVHGVTPGTKIAKWRDRIYRYEGYRICFNNKEYGFKRTLEEAIKFRKELESRA